MLVAALVLRLYAVFELKKGFSNDESVTYLTATGNQVRYANLANPDSIYLNSVMKTNVWKDCYISHPKFCFNKIASGLSHYDIHPPLYFWLMHIFVLLFGLHLYTGLILNLLISVLTLFALYKLALYVFNDTSQSLLVCTIWFLSPAVVQMDLEARHYQLFALFSILVSYSALIILNNRKTDKKNLFLLVLYSTLGLLTHYYFSFVLSGLFVLFLIRFKLTRITFQLAFSFLLSYGLFILIFSDFITFIKGYFSNKGSVRHAHEFQSLIDKIKTQLYATLDFGSFGHLIKYVYLLLLILLIGAVINKIVKKKLFGSFLSMKNIHIIIILFLWNSLFTVLFYMANVSPNQAVGEQYYSYIWPFFAIILVYAISFLNISVWITYSYMLLLFVFCFQSIKHSDYLHSEIPSSWYDEANKSDLIVIDSYDRCMLPRILYFINNEKDIFVGDIHKLKDPESYNNIVVMYLIKKSNNHQEQFNLPFHVLNGTEKYSDTDKDFYFIDSYVK